jgi:hypothetical protein
MSQLLFHLAFCLEKFLLLVSFCHATSGDFVIKFSILLLNFTFLTEYFFNLSVLHINLSCKVSSSRLSNIDIEFALAVLLFVGVGLLLLIED